MKRFLLGVIITYVFLSLPTIFGLGYEIDWIEEATLLQKVKGYVFEGLTNGLVWKMLVSIVTGAFVVGVFQLKKAARLEE